MKLVIFGLTISSSWGNGHATLWRGLCKGLRAAGHEVVFFERDVPYYAQHRDLHEVPGGRLILYDEWDTVRHRAARELDAADAALVTSYCPDGVAAAALVLESSAAVRAFYDLDTPVTLDLLRRGDAVPYLPPAGLADFDLVLSFTGGRALDELRATLGARRVAPLYGSVDPDVHRPAAPLPQYASDLSYLGTFAADRQESLERFLVEPAARQPARTFLIGGAQYPADFPWKPNIRFVRHVPPAEHAAFFCSSRLTLNVTRRAMAEMGYCPSGRLFEAAACGAPLVTDRWEGLEAFFEPGEQILAVRTTEDVQAALDTSDDELQRLARAARDRTLEEHTAARRAAELLTALEDAVPPFSSFAAI